MHKEIAKQLRVQVLEIGDGWLHITKQAIEQIRATGIECTIIGAKTSDLGGLAILADYEPRETIITSIIDAAHDASLGVCVRCGDYSISDTTKLALCRQCLSTSH